MRYSTASMVVKNKSSRGYSVQVFFILKCVAVNPADPSNEETVKKLSERAASWGIDRVASLRDTLLLLATPTATPRCYPCRSAGSRESTQGPLSFSQGSRSRRPPDDPEPEAMPYIHHGCHRISISPQHRVN